MTVESTPSTMRAMRVAFASSGVLEGADVLVPQPRDGHVRVRVEACGVCHSDSVTVSSNWPGISFPRVPGHEIAGAIDALGSGVIGWTTGERVGIGWHGGHCGHCDRCRRGDFLTCRSLQIPGISYDGGYEQYVEVPAVALARIPDALSASEAAPLMCAGVTTFNSLRNSQARAGDLVAILGIGGLGHLGVQYANKMGFETVAIARGAEKAALARELGAHHYIDSTALDPGDELRRMGGAKVVLATATSSKAMEAVLPGLGVDGQLLIVGAANEPLSFNATQAIGERQSVRAWASGTCVDSEDAMKFSVLTGVRAMVETLPLSRATEAYDKMLRGEARFRMVLLPH